MSLVRLVSRLSVGHCGDCRLVRGAGTGDPGGVCLAPSGVFESEYRYCATLFCSQPQFHPSSRGASQARALAASPPLLWGNEKSTRYPPAL